MNHDDIINKCLLHFNTVEQESKVILRCFFKNASSLKTPSPSDSVSSPHALCCQNFTNLLGNPPRRLHAFVGNASSPAEGMANIIPVPRAALPGCRTGVSLSGNLLCTQHRAQRCHCSHVPTWQLQGRTALLSSQPPRVPPV